MVVKSLLANLHLLESGDGKSLTSDEVMVYVEVVLNQPEGFIPVYPNDPNNNFPQITITIPSMYIDLVNSRLIVLLHEILTVTLGIGFLSNPITLPSEYKVSSGEVDELNLAINHPVWNIQVETKLNVSITIEGDSSVDSNSSVDDRLLKELTDDSSDDNEINNKIDQPLFDDYQVLDETIRDEPNLNRCIN